MYGPLEHVTPLQAMVVVGAVPSTATAWERTLSALPVASAEKYLTVLVWVRPKAPA